MTNLSDSLAARRLFSMYAVRLEFIDRVMGGVSKNPEVIESWLRARAGIQQQDELRYAMLRTLADMGVDVYDDMSLEAAIAASKKVAANKATTGFKVDPIHGLYLESRQVKSMLKESINVLYAGDRWGATRKGPRNYAAERVFVTPIKLFIGRRDLRDDVMSPDGVEVIPGHVTGPAGPRNTLAYHEFVTRGILDFTVLVCGDTITNDQWAEIWVHAGLNGLGAVRSQGHGQFKRTRWEKLAVPTPEEFERIVFEDAQLLRDRPLPARLRPSVAAAD